MKVVQDTMPEVVKEILLLEIVYAKETKKIFFNVNYYEEKLKVVLIILTKV